MQEEPRNISFSTPRAVRGLDQVGFDRQVVIEEFGRPRVVGENAADGRRRHEHGLRLSGFHPLLNLSLTAQIDLVAAGCQNLAILARKTPHQRRSHKPAMARDEDPLSLEAIILCHAISFRSLCTISSIN